MNINQKLKFLISLGLVLSPIKDKWAIIESSQMENGYSVIGEDREEVINQAFEFWTDIETPVQFLEAA